MYLSGIIDEDMDELVKICDHIVFNSVSQLEGNTKKNAET